MITADINSFNLGAFTLKVDGQGQFTVIGFQLDKRVGAIGSCTVKISDCTQQVSINNSKYPKKMGRIKELFTSITKTQNIGTLSKVSLIEYTAKGTKVWFTGRLCVVTPVLDTSYGVSAGLQCFCFGKACELLYSPIADFIYVPKNLAMNTLQLKSAGVFDKKIIQDTYSASGKALLSTIIGATSVKDTILQMINKSLSAVMQKKGTRGENLAKEAKININLADYFECDLKLSQAVCKVGQKQHPYTKELITDLYNGLLSVDILTAITNALLANQRFLTYIPAPIKQADKDKLKIWPSYLQPIKEDKSVLLTLDDMLTCTVSANPLMHLKTPTTLYVKPAKLNLWDPSQKTKQASQKLQAMGRYTLPGTQKIQRLQVLDVPAWVLNSVQEIIKRYQSKKNEVKSSQLLNLIQFTQQLMKEEQQKSPSKEGITACQAILNQVAKTKFFNTYMMAKTADITLTVSQKTLNLDQFIGRSISLLMPIEASQLGVTGQRFYGRLQSVKYTFQAARSPRAKSQFSITCQVSGVTAQGSPAAQIFEADDPFFIYKRG